MPKYVIFNTTLYDGVGDFSHFEDIIKALLANPLYHNVAFIPIVSFDPKGSESNYKRIHEKLKALGIPFIYGKNQEHEQLSQNLALQQHLSDADQCIAISADMISPLYRPYCKPGIPFKMIGEHEGWGEYSLGLGEGRHGIKIQPVLKIPPLKAWQIILDNDAEFASQLLTQTDSPTFETFHTDNEIIPAYFNKPDPFINFLCLLAVNDTYPQNKNSLIYLSGLTPEAIMTNNQIKHLLKDAPVGKIELITAGNNSPHILYTNPNYSKTIRILSRFYLSDPSFNAIYQLTHLAAVSGDNTLERCISMNILPYYCSTNSGPKRHTLIALHKITQLPELTMSLEARTSFSIFFSMRHDDLFGLKDKYRLLDLSAMIEAWPAVVGYLTKYCNFYDSLDSIMREGLPETAQPARDATYLTLQSKQTLLALKETATPDIPDAPSSPEIKK